MIGTLIRFVTTSLVCDNLHRRKSMRAADEKLIINELGSYTDEWMTVGDDIPDGREKVFLGGDQSWRGGTVYSAADGPI